MKRKLLIPVLAALFVLLFPTLASASEPEDYITELEQILPESLPITDATPESLADAFGSKTLIAFIADELSGERSRLVSFALAMLGLVTLSFAAESIGKSSLRPYMTLLLSSVALGCALPLIGGVRESLKSADDFFLSLSGILTAITLSSGATMTGATQSAAFALTSTLIGAVSSRVLPALAVFSFAGSILSSVGGDKRILVGARSGFNRILGILTLVFGLFISAQRIVSSAADGAALRAIKYGAGSAIPLVGQSVSSALSLLAGGLGYARDIVGACAVGALVYIFLSPLLLLLLYRLTLSLALTLSELLGIPDHPSLTALLSLFDSLIAAFSLCAVIYIFEIVLFLRLGVAV